MKTNQFSPEDIIKILQEADKAEQSIEAICRAHGVASATFTPLAQAVWCNDGGRNAASQKQASDYQLAASSLSFLVLHNMRLSQRDFHPR
jgi:transposase-like protein